MDIRNKIIEGAGKLFVENGIKQVTMDMIAQSMGISKRTIYENFQDKEDLLSNFLVLTVAGHKEKALEILNNSKNVVEALFNFGVYNHRSMEKINPLFFEDMKKYHNEVFSNVINDGKLRNYNLTYTILKRGQNEGTFIKDIDLEIANRFIHHMLDFFQLCDEEFKGMEQQIWVSAFLPYLKGICTEKGQDIIKKFINKYKN